MRRHLYLHTILAITNVVIFPLTGGLLEAASVECMHVHTPTEGRCSSEGRLGARIPASLSLGKTLLAVWCWTLAQWSNKQCNIQGFSCSSKKPHVTEQYKGNGADRQDGAKTARGKKKKANNSQC